MPTRSLPRPLGSARALGFAAVAALAGAAGCSKGPAEDGVKVLGAGEHPGEKHYPISGEIVSVDASKRVLTVRHEAVQGLMPAMTMEFAVSAADASLARPGERIRADLVLGPSGSLPRLERIWPDDKVANDTLAAAERTLREDTHQRGNSAYREVGEAMPAFALEDQSGRVVRSERFRGKQIMLNFIFSRCPIATMCPASTAKMMAAQKLAREAGVPNIEFVSITLDPTYDTPGVLKEYAEARGIDTTNFSFLTGPQNAIRDLLEQFGVIAEFQGDFVKHTLATLLIDANGRIAWRADGSVWDPADFVARMRKDR